MPFIKNMSAKVSLAYGRYGAIVANRQLPPHYPQQKLLRCKDTIIFGDIQTKQKNQKFVLK